MRSYQNRKVGFTLIELIVCIVLLAIVVSVICAVCRRSAPENITTAMLKFERQSSAFGIICSMNVYVNQLKVATVANGSITEITFPPNKDGNNTLSVELVSPIGVSNKSPVSDFYATPGAVVSARSEVNGWVWKMMPDINLTVVREKDGVAPVELIDMTLDPALVKREVSTETISGPPGTHMKITRFRTIDHWVNITNTRSAELGINVGPEFLGAALRGRLESQENQAFHKSETKEEVIDVDCNQVGRADIVWVDYIRRGTATVRLNGVVQTIEFEAQKDTQLTVRKY
ncbi:MAG: hypothetical protein JWN14_2726 [Chthonomonadales bacterium]|nr:hypothetical protein [Chthonomonadales bacterium]